MGDNRGEWKVAGSGLGNSVLILAPLLPDASSPCLPSS